MGPWQQLKRRFTERTPPAPTGAAMPDVLHHFHPVLPSPQLGREPRRVVLAGQAYVLFRDRGGRAAALLDACPHRLAPLSEGHVRPDGRLACPYHGWHFDADGRGCSPSQPELSKCDVASFQVVERHGYLWLAGKDVPVERMPDIELEGFESAGTFQMLYNVPLHVALDNFSENEHTPWVHTRLGWDDATLADVSFEAHNFDDRTEVHYRAPQRDSRLTPLLLLRSGDVFHNRWVTRFNPVRTEYTLYWTHGSDEQVRPVVSRAVIFFVPETETTTRYHVFAQVRINQRLLRPLLPAIKRVAMALAWMELDDDRRFVPILANTPPSLKGMRLGRFDKPIIHNRKLLKKLYFGESELAQRLRVVTS